MTKEASLPGETVVALSRPVIDQDGKEHTSLTLTMPSGAAFLKIGDPYLVVILDGGKSRAVDQNRDRLLSYVAEVCGIHKPLLMAMNFRDIQKVTDEMLLFFG